MKTFEFKSEKNWLKVWEALNDTMYAFTSYAYKCITVFDIKVANELEEQLKECHIRYSIV